MPGITVIVCSKNPEQCEETIESIKNSAGVDIETKIFDNRDLNWGLCKVYNYCASDAKYSYLCFAHEDIIISTPGWGRIFIEYINKTPNCGVIGFAGGMMVSKLFLSWNDENKDNYRCRYYDPDRRDKEISINNLKLKYNNPYNECFANVVTLDGFFLFVKKETWEENLFDEKLFHGFHFYDADFTFGIAQKKQNYVYLQADIYHLSGGKRDENFYKNAMVFQKKWKDKLPYNNKKNIKKEMINAFELFNHSGYYQYKLKEIFLHLIEINGCLFFLLFLLYLFYRTIKKGIKIFIRQYQPDYSFFTT